MVLAEQDAVAQQGESGAAIHLPFAGSGLPDASDTLPVALCHRIVGWSILGAWRMMTRDA